MQPRLELGGQWSLIQFTFLAPGRPSVWKQAIQPFWFQADCLSRNQSLGSPLFWHWANRLFRYKLLGHPLSWPWTDRGRSSDSQLSAKSHLVRAICSSNNTFACHFLNHSTRKGALYITYMMASSLFWARAIALGVELSTSSTCSHFLILEFFDC